MHAGDSNVGVLAACDRTFPNDTQIEERAVGLIPANERCPVCQGVQVAAERSPIVTPDDTG
jgi:cytochrome c-type biogenesis protein CcmH/NrfF